MSMVTCLTDIHFTISLFSNNKVILCYRLSLLPPSPLPSCVKLLKTPFHAHTSSSQTLTIYIYLSGCTAHMCPVDVEHHIFIFILCYTYKVIVKLYYCIRLSQYQFNVCAVRVTCTFNYSIHHMLLS